MELKCTAECWMTCYESEKGQINEWKECIGFLCSLAPGEIRFDFSSDKVQNWQKGEFRKVDFLDHTIMIGEGWLVHKLNFKPMNMQCYIEAHSAHAILKNCKWIHGLELRLLRDNSREDGQVGGSQ